MPLERSGVNRTLDKPDWREKLTVENKELVLFTRQLVALLEGGVNLVGALGTLANRPEKDPLRLALEELHQSVSSGNYFSRSLALFPRVFPPVFIAMVQLGENTGQLDAAMARLAAWLESDQAVRQKVKAALGYPCFILALTSLLTLGLFYGVMPTFSEIFSGMGIPLPWPTRILMVVTGLIRMPLAWVCFGLAQLGMVRLIQRAWTHPEIKVRIYRMFLSVPLIGEILLLSATSRFASTLQAVLDQGLSLALGLRLAASASGSPVFIQDAAAGVKAIERGELLSQHMSESDAGYPHSLVSMLGAGEESAAIPRMLERAGQYYQVELDARIQAFGAALEPILMVLVASLVAGIMLAIFLPLYSYLGQLG